MQHLTAIWCLFFEQHIDLMPLFVSEWGISDAGGNGPYDATTAEEILNICSGLNDFVPPFTVVSWLQWSFTDKDETASILEPNSCRLDHWHDI